MAKRYTLREAVALLDKLENDLVAANRKMVALAVRQGEILHRLKNSGKIKDWQDAAEKTKRSLSWVRNRERLYRLRGIIAKADAQYAAKLGIPAEQQSLHGIWRRLTCYKYPDRAGQPGTTDLRRYANSNVSTSRFRSESTALDSSLERYNQKFTPVPLDGGELYIEEWEKILPTLPDASVDIAFADPPYYPKKRQETHKWTDAIEIMLEYHQELHAEIKRVLKPRGSLFTFGNFLSIPCAYVAMRRVGLHVLNEIIWVRGSNPPGRGHHLERRHENVLWCTRGSRARWNFDEVKAADYPDDYFRKSKFDGRTKNIQLSDCWHFPDEAPDIIEAMPIMRKTPETIGIPMKPLPLILRLLDMVQVHGGTVLDPFAGSGQFILAARTRNMRFIACECDKGRADLIKRRIGLVKSADAAD